MRPFSKRHEEAIFGKRLKVSISKRLRKRIWLILEDLNHSTWVRPDPADNWANQSSILAELPALLKRSYGVDKLEAFNDSDRRVKVDLKGFVEGAYPAQVLDVIELFNDELMDDLKGKFQQEINNIFEEEGCPWRLVDGQFFKVDSDFLCMQLATRSQELMKAEGFQGALDEFRDARNDMAAGDHKGAIHNACKSFESVLKTVLGHDTGNASALIRELADAGFYEDMPERFSGSFGDSVLMALPFIRNRLGGHGQGEEVVSVSKVYAELAVHLAGAFILFVIQKDLEMKPRPSEPEPDGNDIPF